MSISIQSIHKTFGTYTALDDISLEVPDGSLTALLGPSGSGKTTLLRIVAGLEMADPGSGRILFHGNDVSEVAAGKRGVGFVFQHYALFTHMSISQNIAFGLDVMPHARRPKRAEIRQRVDELLRLVRLEGLANRRPHELSGGQRQRVALARAFLRNAPILILDEATNALDSKSEEFIQIALKKLMAGRTVLIIAHRFSTIRDASVILVFDKGGIVAAGPHAQPYSASPLYKSLYDLQGASA